MEQVAPPGLVHDLLRVARLVPVEQEVTTIQADAMVRDALEIMERLGFDQLPVCVGSHVMGVFSYRSLARSLRNVRRNDDPLDQRVEDVLEDLEFVRASQDVGPLLSLLERDGAVLIGEESRLDAVMTLSDVTTYLWQVTRPFVLLQDIELAVRSLMEEACAEPNGLADVLERALLPERLTQIGQPYSLRELTLGELLRVLLQGQNYGRNFHATFGGNKSIATSALEPVRDVRNKVFHFRDEVTSEELDVLVLARTYLRRRVDLQNARRA